MPTIIKLKSLDQVEHEVPLGVANMSNLVKEILNDEDNDDDDDEDDEDKEKPSIDLLKVRNEILIKVIDFCKHYQEEPMSTIEPPLNSTKLEDLVQPWYVNFIQPLDQPTLFELVSAANYMDIKELLSLACLGVSILCQNKSEDEIRKMFGVEKPSQQSSSASEDNKEET